ncbi:MAG TPA: hypothetical protein ENK60_04485 [Anaerolineae bacterium]|nr:hypothetical protein [Anaerolineae bacterium]
MNSARKDRKILEQMLIETVKTLDDQHAMQVLDFARWLQTQPSVSEMEEAAWEEVYLRHKEAFRKMAQEALQELDADETLEMTAEGDHIQIR